MVDFIVAGAVFVPAGYIFYRHLSAGRGGKSCSSCSGCRTSCPYAER